MMNTHKRNSPIPFALTSDGRLVDVSAVDSGLIEEATCPACEGKLVAKKGMLRSHHFAHYSATTCSGALETALHRAAKQVLIDAQRDGSAFYAPAFSGLVGRGRGKYPARHILMTQVEGEATVFLPGEHRRPDAVVTWEGGRLAVEICVTNPVDDDRASFYERAGLDCIEIDLSYLAKQFSDGKSLQIPEVSDAVLRAPNTRKWVCRSDWIHEMLKAEGGLDQVPHFGKFTIGQADALLA